MKQLFRKNVNSVGQWRIWAEGAVIHIAHSTVLGGSEVHHTETVETNLSGRTLMQQVQLRINSRISRMRDKGYKDTEAEALRCQGNQLGLERPMLAQKLKDVRNINYDRAVLQKKLDGHRCLITVQDGELIAYSRQGKRIDTIRHILRGLKERLPEGTTIDGELYCHGFKLQTLASWIKREQENTYRLYFVGYDLISDDSYLDRHLELTELIQGCDTNSPGKIMALPHVPYQDQQSTSELFRETRSRGFEGLMLRTHGRGYEPGVRSNSLIKIKEFEDGEVTVVGFRPSKTGWAICTCRTDDGKIVDVSAPGSVQEKQHVMDNPDQYLHRRLTIEYAHLTDDGIPFQPTALRWRDDV